MVLLTLLAIAVSAFAALCLMLVGLLETPWPILLGGLLLALYGLQRLSAQSQMLANQAFYDVAAPTRLEDPKPFENQAPAAPQPTQPAQPEMMYRGIRYSPKGQANPSAEAPAAANPADAPEGTSRGRLWQRPQVSSLVQPGSVPELIYRGRKVRPPQGPEKTS